MVVPLVKLAEIVREVVQSPLSVSLRRPRREVRAGRRPTGRTDALPRTRVRSSGHDGEVARRRQGGRRQFAISLSPAAANRPPSAEIAQRQAREGKVLAAKWSLPLFESARKERPGPIKVQLYQRELQLFFRIRFPGFPPVFKTARYDQLAYGMSAYVWQSYEKTSICRSVASDGQF